MELALATGRGPAIVTDLEGRRPLVRDEDVVAFVRELPESMLKSKATVRLRGSGRYSDVDRAFGVDRFGGDRFIATRSSDRPTPTERRPGSPVARVMPRSFDDEMESQDAPAFVPGERVRHARFGSGTIAELSGTGKETKVTIDFDDETIGRKRLVAAYAALERGVG